MASGTLEVGGAVIWTASAVYVAGETFQAFKKTYKQFPGPGGGTAPGALQGPQLPGAGQPIPKGTPGTGQGTGGTPLEPHASPPAGKNVKAPPVKLISQVTYWAQRGNRKWARVAWTRVIAWSKAGPQKRAGWSERQVTQWATTQPWWNKFFQTVGGNDFINPGDTVREQ